MVGKKNRKVSESGCDRSDTTGLSMEEGRKEVRKKLKEQRRLKQKHKMIQAPP